MDSSVFNLIQSITAIRCEITYIISYLFERKSLGLFAVCLKDIHPTAKI